MGHDEQCEKQRPGNSTNEIEYQEISRSPPALHERAKKVETQTIERDMTHAAMKKLEGEKLPDLEFSHRRVDRKDPEITQRPATCRRRQHQIEKVNCQICDEQGFYHWRDLRQKTRPVAMVSAVIISICNAHLLPVNMGALTSQERGEDSVTYFGCLFPVSSSQCCLSEDDRVIIAPIF